MNLTKEQLTIIELWPEAKAVVSAVPGSGKTRVLVSRILKLIELGIDPKGIAAITFTNNAAREMEARLGESKIGYVGTIHKLLLNVIRFCWRDLGFSSKDISPMDEDSFDALVSDAITVHGYKKLKSSLLEEIHSTGHKSKTAIYIETMMKVHGLVPFDSIVKLGLQAYRAGVAPTRFTHVLLDEAQDTSDTDAELFSLLTNQAKGALVVGDPNQSIYGFRGGSPEFMQRLIADERNFGFFGLTETFRCTRQICEFSNSLSQTYKGLIGSNMQSSREGEPVAFVKVSAEDNAPQLLARMAKGSIEAGTKRVAILARLNDEVASIREAALAQGLKVARKYSKSGEWSYCVAALSALLKPECPLAGRRYLTLKLGKSEAEKVIRQNEISFMPVGYGHVPDLMICGCVTLPVEHIAQGLNEMGVTASAIAVFQSVAAKVSSSEELLMECVGLRDESEDDSDVFIGTIHSAKGLEFDHVILAPFVPATEEHARLYYVAVTRAKSLLTICTTAE